MFKRVFSFILIMVMLICTITANAKDVYFATHRQIQNEYGELLPRSDREAYCPTRIEVDYDAKTLFIKTKTHGTASYMFSDYDYRDLLGTTFEEIAKKAIVFFNAKGEIIGSLFFTDYNYSDFLGLTMYRKNNTAKVIYVKLKQY